MKKITNYNSLPNPPIERCSIQEYYRRRPDVANAKMDATIHFSRHGLREQMCQPSYEETCTYFQYYAKRPDVLNANIDASTHYITHGKFEHVQAN